MKFEPRSTLKKLYKYSNTSCRATNFLKSVFLSLLLSYFWYQATECCGPSFLLFLSFCEVLCVSLIAFPPFPALSPSFRLLHQLFDLSCIHIAVMALVSHQQGSKSCGVPLALIQGPHVSLQPAIDLRHRTEILHSPRRRDGKTE